MKFSFQSTLFIWFLIGSYLNMSLVIYKGIFIPNFIAYIAGGVLLIIHLKKFLVKKYLFFVLGFLLASLLSIIFSPKLVSGILKEQLLSFLQLFLSMFTAMGLLFFLRSFDSNKVARIFFVFVIVLLVGSSFERLIPLFASMSDWFRFTFYDSGVYIADQRDLKMVGFIRPKFFSREPSFVSQFLVLFLLFWHSLSNFASKNIVVITLALFSVFITGSPKIIILFPLLLLFNLHVIKKLVIKYNFLFILLFSIIMMSVIFSSFFLFEQRIEDALAGKDQSFNMRILVPAAVIGFVLARYPFFGVGLGAKENSLLVFNDTLSSFGYDWMVTQNFEPNFHSYFLESIHFYGILGIVLIAYTFNKFLLRGFSRNKKFIFWISLILISLMGGSVVGVRTWLTVVLVYFCIDKIK